jgi:hypothetical protein
MTYFRFEEGMLSKRVQSERRNMGKRIQTNMEASSRLWRGAG